jgi:hypothetical protein
MTAAPNMGLGRWPRGRLDNLDIDIAVSTGTVAAWHFASLEHSDSQR